MEKLGYNITAETNYKLSLNIQPSRFAPRYALMLLYLHLGDKEKSIDMAKGIVQLRPKVPSKEVEFYKKEAEKVLGSLITSKS